MIVILLVASDNVLRLRRKRVMPQLGKPAETRTHRERQHPFVRFGGWWGAMPPWVASSSRGVGLVGVWVGVWVVDGWGRWVASC